MQLKNIIRGVLYVKPFGTKVRISLKKRRKSSLFLAFVFFYFAFHLVTGERGLLAYVQLKGELSEKTRKAAAVHEAKVDLAGKVSGLRTSSLNLDLLEEVARRDLGYSRKDEVIYFPEE